MAETVELRDNNLYYNGYINNYPDDGELELLRPLLNIVAAEEDQWHTITEADRLDILAWKYYKNVVSDASKYWWVIADANNIYNPLDLTELVGTSILIPDILRIRLLL